MSHTVESEENVAGNMQKDINECGEFSKERAFSNLCRGVLISCNLWAEQRSAGMLELQVWVEGIKFYYCKTVFNMYIRMKATRPISSHHVALKLLIKKKMQMMQINEMIIVQLFHTQAKLPHSQNLNSNKLFCLFLSYLT